MTTADWALIISLLSFSVALAGFVWNVWSKFIFPKPRVEVGISFVGVYEEGKEMENLVSLTAVNHGPSQATLYHALMQSERSLFRSKRSFGILNPLNNYPAQYYTIGPFGGGLPKKVDVGEQFAVYFIPDHPEIADGKWSKIGFSDTFGRMHWASRRQFEKVRQEVRDYRAKHPAKADQS